MSKKKIFLTDEAKKDYYEALDLFQPLGHLFLCFKFFCGTETIPPVELMQRVAEFFSLGAYVFRVLGYAETFFVTVKLF